MQVKYSKLSLVKQKVLYVVESNHFFWDTSQPIQIQYILQIKAGLAINLFGYRWYGLLIQVFIMFLGKQETNTTNLIRLLELSGAFLSSVSCTCKC